MSQTQAKRTRFVSEIAKGMTIIDAYRAAGYRTDSPWVHQNAQKVLRHPEVQAQVERIRKQSRDAVPVSVAYITSRLLDAADMAQRLEKPADMTGAMMGVDKLHGFLIDRATLDVMVNKPSAVPTDVLDLSVDDWARANQVLLPGMLGDPSPEPQPTNGGSDAGPRGSASPEGETPLVPTSIASPQSTNDINHLGDRGLWPSEPPMQSPEIGGSEKLNEINGLASGMPVAQPGKEPVPASGTMRTTPIEMEEVETRMETPVKKYTKPKSKRPHRRVHPYPLGHPKYGQPLKKGTGTKKISKEPRK